MGIKLVIRRDKKNFEDEINSLLNDGFKIEFAYNTNDDRNAAIMSNGLITKGMNSKEIDNALAKECNELKNTIKMLEKEKSMLQDSLADAQNKYAEAMADGEKISEHLEIEKEAIRGLEDTIAELKKELATCKGQNTKLQNKINKLIEE